MPLIKAVVITPKSRLRTILSAVVGGPGYQLELDIQQVKNLLQNVNVFLDAGTKAEVAKITTILNKLQSAGATVAILSLYPVDAKPLTIGQTIRALR